MGLPGSPKPMNRRLALVHEPDARVMVSPGKACPTATLNSATLLTKKSSARTEAGARAHRKSSASFMVSLLPQDLVENTLPDRKFCGGSLTRELAHQRIQVRIEERRQFQRRQGTLG